MYTTQVDLYEIIKRFTEPARTPETFIFVVYLRFRLARVLAICGRFRGPISGPPGRFLGPPSTTPLPPQKARNHYFCSILALDRRPRMPKRKAQQDQMTATQDPNRCHGNHGKPPSKKRAQNH